MYYKRVVNNIMTMTKDDDNLYGPNLNRYSLLVSIKCIIGMARVLGITAIHFTV